jgi:NAD-dependent DNA ligase
MKKMKKHVAEALEEALEEQLRKTKRDLWSCRSELRRAKPAKKLAKSSDKPLKGLAFVFTGKMSYFPRAEAQKLARKAGAKTPSSLSRGVDYLVFGSEGSPKYAAGNEGTKHARARELGVKVISEKAFLKMLGIKAEKF